MYRTNVVELVANKEQKKLLLELMTLSSCVWNMANYNFRQAIIKNEKVKSFYNQRKAIQNNENYQRLGRSYALPIIQKHSFVVNAFFKLIKSGIQKRVGLPKYYKNRKTNTTILSLLRFDALQYYFKNNKVHLPLSRKLRKELGLKGIVLEYKGMPKWKGKQGQAEIHYNSINKKFYLHQSVELKEPKIKKGNKVLAIDIGIIRGITAFDNKMAYLYHNPIIKKWKKLTARISRLQKIAKGRNSQYTTKQINSLYGKRKRMVDDYYKNIVSWVIKKTSPSRIIVGDVSHILDKSSKSKANNRMLHNLWTFNLLYKRLENKCQEKGILLEKVPEPYTSMICPNCGTFNKPYKREYSCICGYQQDRDVNGAINIFYQNTDKKVLLYPVVESHHLLVGDLR